MVCKCPLKRRGFARKGVRREVAKTGKGRGLALVSKIMGLLEWWGVG